MKLGFWVAPEGPTPLCPSFRLATKPERRAAGERRCFLSRHQQRRAVDRAMPARGRAAAKLAQALQDQDAAAPGRLFDITDYAPDDLELITQVLGEARSADSRRSPTASSRKSPKPRSRLWRVRFMDARTGWRRLSGSRRHSGDCPARGGPHRSAPVCAAPEGAMNVMPLLAEIAERMSAWREGEPSHASISRCCRCRTST